MLAGSANECMLERIDQRIACLEASRVQLLHSIAELVPGYSIALGFAVGNLAFNEAHGTVRYCKRRDGCFTFGMPGQPVNAVWVVGGIVKRSEPMEW